MDDLRAMVMVLMFRHKHAIGGVIPDFACWFYRDLDHRPALSVCHHLYSVATGLGVLCPGLVAFLPLISRVLITLRPFIPLAEFWVLLSPGTPCLSNLKCQNATLLSLKPVPQDVRQYSSPQQQGQSISLPLEVELALLSYKVRLQGPAFHSHAAGTLS